jgi:hypothetical protein
MSQVGPLLEQIAEPVASFTGDGAYEGRQHRGDRDLQKSRDNRTTAAKSLGAGELSAYFPTTVYLSSQTIDKS